MADDPRFKFLSVLADAAGETTLPRFRTGLAAHSKDSESFDPVTAADREAERAMRDLIAATFPEDGIVGEEFGAERTDGEIVWYLDPIDGTRSFLSGVPVWGTLIGFTREGKPSAGVMAQPFTGERFLGDGDSARYEGPGGPQDLRSRPCATIAEAVLFTTAPNLFNPADRTGYDRIEQAVRLARYGTDCYAYCMLAGGHIDLVIEADLHSYDIMPLIPIIEGAGGIITDWEGGTATAGGRVVAAGDPRMHAQALALLAAK